MLTEKEGIAAENFAVWKLNGLILIKKDTINNQHTICCSVINFFSGIFFEIVKIILIKGGD